jgi:nicotinamide mononucleotide adenylyltransferase
MSTLGCIAKGLAPAEHRIRLCQLATQDSPFVMVDSWEATQSSYQRTLTVLSRVEAAVNSRAFAAEEKVRVMLLCGTDLLESMTKPGIWIPEQVRVLLQEHGVVCICRTGQDTRQLLLEHDILFSNRRHIMIVDELIHNDVSSTKVRRNIARGLSVKYLVADTVINYIKTHQLYTSNPVAHQP